MGSIFSDNLKFYKTANAVPLELLISMTFLVVKKSRGTQKN